MKGYSVAVASVLLLASISAVAGEYWFQFGAVGGSNTEYNHGVSADIETSITHNITSGSISFWVGETLSNGAFLQFGYLEPNESGKYPMLCTLSGCSNYEYSNASQAEWFYEYFPYNYSGGQFLGAIGPTASAGTNGTFNNYALYSSGDTWDIMFNGNVIGSLNMHASTSGINAPIAFGEIANSSGSPVYINNAIFKNFDIYESDQFLPVSEAYSFIGYGVGSKKGIRDPYGVMEVGNRINYFAAGSGLPQPPNYTQLWGFGYIIRTISEYGNVSKAAEYSAYTKVPISVPPIIYLSNDTRVIFKDWIGSGIGSYTGNSNSITVSLESNITEKAEWLLQYHVNVSSRYVKAYGSGWYDSGSLLKYGVEPALVYQNASSRAVFSGWTTGTTMLNASMYVNAPLNISAIWIRQYLVNITTPYGSASGTGWYISGSFDNISLNTTIINSSGGERMAFYSWSNGSSSPALQVSVGHPITLNAVFRRQYLATIMGIDSEGTPLKLDKVFINGSRVNKTLYLFGGNLYNVSSVVYKGTNITLDSDISVNSSSVAYLWLPVRDLAIRTLDIFGMPVNASVVLTFGNGTVYSTYTGSRGSLALRDVPYGEAQAVVTYLGITSSKALSNSNNTTLLFVSLTDIIVFIAVGLLAFALHEVSRRYLHKKHSEYYLSKANAAEAGKRL